MFSNVFLNIKIPLLTILRTLANGGHLCGATDATQMEAGKEESRTLDADRLVNRTRAETTPRSLEDEHNGATACENLGGKRS